VVRGLFLAIASLAIAAPAAAQHGTIPTQQFAPAPGGDNNYVTVQGTGVLEAWRTAVGLYLNYAYEPLFLRRTESEDRVALVENHLQLDLVAALGLFGVMEIGVAVPVTLWQKEGDPSGSLQPSALNSPVVNDIRLYPKLSIVHDPEGFGMALLALVTLPSGSPEDLQGNESVTVEPRLAFQYAFSDQFRLALSGGFVYRPTAQTLFNVTVGNEVTFGAGIEYQITPRKFALIGEGFGKISIESGATSQANPIEVGLAARWWPGLHHALTLGVGRGLTDGYGAPNFRAYLGYNYTPRTEEVVFVETRNPDTDGDGLCDPWVSLEGKSEEYAHICRGIDECPNDPEDYDGFEDEDGCPDPDNDNDGFCDPWVAERGLSDRYAHICRGVDKCPNEPGPDSDDGCPRLDSDGDGIPDDEDPCPFDPTNTCDMVTVNPCEIVITETVFFRYNSFEIDEQSFPILDAVASVIIDQDWINRLEVQGHTDSDGPADMNMALSQSRADSVMRHLVGKGVPQQRLQARGYGLTRPIASNATAEGRAQNRRVQFIIVDPSQEDCQ